jgi:hypothetical protein
MAGNSGMINAYMILVRQPEGKILLGIFRCRWEDSIKMDCKEIRCEDSEWIQLAQYRFQWLTAVNIVMNVWFKKRLKICLSARRTFSCSY